MASDPLAFPKSVLRSLDPSIRFDGMTPNAIASEFREVVKFLADEFKEHQTRVDIFDEEPGIFRFDTSIPVKRVVNWQGLSIGITHEPGGHRFNGMFSRPLLKNVSYGHIRRSRKSAPDKKAFDVYYGNQESDSLFKIRQLTLEGLIDEPKYMIGFPSITAARDIYIAHAGRDRFGGIEQVPIDELSQYRSTAYHQDACDCEKCSLHRDRNKRRKRKNVAARLQSSENREDRIDADDPDLSDLLCDRALDATTPVFEKWLDHISNRIEKAETLEEVRDRLSESYKKINSDEFATLLMQHRITADLGGRLEILEELENGDRNESDESAAE